MADITMSKDETLELDAIIEQSSRVDSVIGVDDRTDYNLDGFQTHTGVFNPQGTGEYNIKVNGQTLTVQVNEANAIPDRGRLHLFDFRDSASLTLTSGTIESIDDQDTNTTLSTGAISGGLTEINGFQAARFDGNDDYLEGDVGDLEPYDVHIVSQPDTTGIGQAMLSCNNINSDVRIYNGNFQMVEEETLDGAPENTNANVVSAHFDGVDSELIINGNSSTGNVSGGRGEHGLTRVVIGQGGNDARPWNGAIAVVGVYDPTNNNYDRLEVHKDYQSIFGI